ncbi:MAG TPA: oligosaccharide flippase family protein [Chitinophagaceae bacterium]|nr:oligosaccharide flippase family protein [Chitinophagaceae bacterium]
MILLNMLVKPLWIFGIDRQVQLQVGQMEYGRYFALLNLSFIFNILLDMGITGYSNRTIALTHSSSSTLIYQAFITKLLFSILYLLIIFIVAVISGVTDYTLLFFLTVIQILSSFLLLGRGVLSAYQQFNKDAWLSILDKTLLIVFAGSWLYFPFIKTKFTIYDFALLQIVATVITVFVCFFFLRKNLLFDFTTINKWQIKNIIKESLPYAITILFMGIHSRADGFLLERLGANGSYEAGMYAAAYRLLDAANMIGFLFASILISYWAKHTHNKPLIERSLTFSHQLLIPSGILIGSTVFFLYKPLYSLLYYNTNLYGETILKWNLLCILPLFIIHIYGTLLTATGKIKMLMRLVFLAALVNILANFFLIPYYGALACVYIALITQTGLAVCTIIACGRQLKISVSVVLWIKYVLIASFIILLLLFITNYTFSVWLKLVLVTALWLLLGNILNVFSFRSFLNLIREN